jgi:subtilisin-like proprotein convertase family protein
MTSALANAATNGRGGKGTIMIWAAGNGKLDENDSNYDGYANSIYTIAVAATDSFGRSSYYSEPGANILVAAPSSGNGGALGIVTTDRTGSFEYDSGYNGPGDSSELSDRNYTKSFGGTSSATPAVAGVVALMLEKNPNLGWRDVQEILIRSATPFLTSDAGWRTNGAGWKFNHQFGAGLVNATAAVDRAATWTNLPEQTSLSVSQNTSTSIPNLNDTGVTKSFDFSSTTHRVEHVTVRLTATHSRRGNLDITLTSPSGMVSQLASVVTNDTSSNYSNWTFSSVHHWGESAAGTWTVRVSDRSNLGNTTGGTLSNVTVSLFGSSTLPVNPPPQVAITSPMAGQIFSLGSAVNVQVSASDIALDGSTGVISNVELLVDGSVVASDATAPYQFTVNPPPGVRSLVARATDSEGGVNSSAAVSISLLNQSPVITAASLSASAPHYADQPLSVSAVTASDPEGSSLTYAYQWQSSTDQNIYANASGKTSATLAPLAANAGKLWRCVVTASDGSKTSAPFTTAAVNLVTRPPTIVTTGSSYQYTSELVLKGVVETVNRRAIINEFSQGPPGTTAEWIELLVLQSGSLAGFQLAEAAGSTPLTLSNHALWNDVPAGTLVVIYRGDSSSTDPRVPPVDTNVSDKRLVVASNTAAYFSSTNWIVLASVGDSISLRTDSGTAIHSLCFGNVSTFPLHVGNVGNAQAAYFAGGTDLDANAAVNWGTASATVAGSAENPGAGVTPGAANSPANQSFITKLRTNTLVTPALFRLGAGTSLPGDFNLNPSTGEISGTIAPGNVGNHPIVIERYNTLGEVVSQSYTLTVVPANYAEWIGGYVVASNAAADDPDLDGLPSLVEYMLGLDPNVREATQAIATTVGTESISLTYRQSKLRTDGTLVPQWATGLDASATWQTTGLTTEVLEEDEQSKLLRVSLPVAPADEKRFLRLRATTNP